VRSVEVVLTTACNLGCAYCYQNVRTERSMSWRVLRRALDLVSSSNHPNPEINFYGGEPVLELPLIVRAIEYLEKNQTAGGRVGTSVFTNGTLLDRGTRRFLARRGIATQISLDGVEAAQELRAPGTFARIDRTLARLNDEHPEFLRDRCSVSITLSSSNVGHLAESFAHLLDRDICEIVVAPLVTHDGGWQPHTLELLADQIAEIACSSVDHFRSTGKVPFVSFKRPGDGESREDSAPAMCSAVTGRNPTVDVDGRVYGCVLFAESYQSFPNEMLRECLDSMRIGNIRDTDFSRRLDEFSSTTPAAIFMNQESKHSSYRSCKGCRYLGACSVCPVSIAHIPGNEDVDRIPDIQCAFNLAVLAAREMFFRETDSETTTA